MIYKKHRKLSQERHRFKHLLPTVRTHAALSQYIGDGIGSPLHRYELEREYYNINGQEYYDIICILSNIVSKAFDDWDMLSRYLRLGYINRLSDVCFYIETVVERY